MFTIYLCHAFYYDTPPAAPGPLPADFQSPSQRGAQPRAEEPAEQQLSGM